MGGQVQGPILGRFLSADPTVPYPESSQSFNRYSYGQNNPTSRIDPSGFTDRGFSLDEGRQGNGGLIWIYTIRGDLLVRSTLNRPPREPTNEELRRELSAAANSQPGANPLDVPRPYEDDGDGVDLITGIIKAFGKDNLAGARDAATCIPSPFWCRYRIPLPQSDDSVFDPENREQEAGYEVFAENQIEFTILAVLITRRLPTARSRSVPISGNSQVTRKAGVETTHASTSQRIANEQAQRTDARSVHMNQTVGTITEGSIDSRVRPDVATVRTDGKIDAFEVLSPGQTVEQQTRKLQKALGDRAGEIRCVGCD